MTVLPACSISSAKSWIWYRRSSQPHVMWVSPTYNGYVTRYEKAKTRVDTLQEQKKQRQTRADIIGGFMFAVHERDAGVTEFDNALWLAVVQKATAYHDGRLVFTFQNGMEIEG